MALLDWREIDGWLSEAEGSVLAVLACGKEVLEIGSYKGRSTVCMARTAREVWSVDHHKGDRNTGPADTAMEFVRNLCAAGVEPKVNVSLVPIEGHEFHDGMFDMAFIDAAHDADSVERHTRIAMKVVKPGGLIVWHDWDQSGVREGVVRCGLMPTAFTGSLAWLTI